MRIQKRRCDRGSGKSELPKQKTRVFERAKHKNNALRTLRVREYSFEHDYYVLRQNKLAETNERTLVYEVKLRQLSKKKRSTKIDFNKFAKRLV